MFEAYILHVPAKLWRYCCNRSGWAVWNTHQLLARWLDITSGQEGWMWKRLTQPKNWPLFVKGLQCVWKQPWWAKVSINRQSRDGELWSDPYLLSGSFEWASRWSLKKSPGSSQKLAGDISRWYLLNICFYKIAMATLSHKHSNQRLIWWPRWKTYLKKVNSCKNLMVLLSRDTISP